MLPELALCLMLLAPDKDKDKDNAKDKDKPVPMVEPPKVIPIAQVSGTLQDAGETGMIKLRVPIRRIEPNAQAQAAYPQQQQEWMKRQWDIMQNPNPVQRYQQMVQLANDVQQAQKNLFVLKETHVDLELQTTDDLKVRNAVPMPGFDEMGNIRQLTKEVLMELKGKENLPGFTAEKTDLKNGQTVVIIAGRERDNKDPMAKPIAMLILILVEPKP
jgi:hypothetical protein